MRVLQPRDLQRRRKVSFWRRAALPLAGVGVVAVGVAGYVLWHGRTTKASDRAVSEAAQVEAAHTIAQPKLKPKTFAPNEFRDLYRAVLPTYPNTQEFTGPPAITGSATVDAHIRAIAEARGFQLTRMPVTSLIKLNEHLVSGEKDDLLQPAAFQSWEQIKAAAAASNAPLALMSAYRSPDFQRDLFMQRLLARNVTDAQLANNNADAALQANMGVTAVPGYSRHHTGYTVDFWCEDGSGTFANSSCFKWLSADNYLHAKESGWIPSYPEGADEQGPEPEAWEYVWVGHDLLFE